MSSVIIEEEHYIPYSVAKKYVYELIRNGNNSSILQRTYEYLNSITKCNDEDAAKLMEELAQLVEKEEIRAVIASICPTTVDEVRSILASDSKNYGQEILEKIVELVKKYLQKG
ncbi:DNA-directed RNA polymerase subunit F [Acidianus infernus]|uniref:DNA-directed RNA polymerase subunit Rpo4 n=1 Tax=Acidianus infernus TaxID=12915 RepID=A0A6A9QFB2_ACIIN|nr:DNA-directed RNA polymerase subunit F [Acidianus infernus]MUM64463.1 DNA-directed RNA polymerase subunit F [Acidianus infernus]